MEVLLETPVRFPDRYELAAPRGDTNILAWRSHTPEIGVLNGTFVVAGGTIMSLFRSEDARVAGSEHLTYVDSDRDQARGVFAASGEVISAWSMALIREP